MTADFTAGLPTRASREVIDHAAALHEARCAAATQNAVVRPLCANAITISCGGCGEPVFVAIRPGGVRCAHVERLVGAR